MESLGIWPVVYAGVAYVGFGLRRIRLVLSEPEEDEDLREEARVGREEFFLLYSCKPLTAIAILTYFGALWLPDEFKYAWKDWHAAGAVEEKAEAIAGIVIGEVGLYVAVCLTAPFLLRLIS